MSEGILCDFNTFGQSRITDTGYQQDYFGGQIGLDIAGGSGERGGFAAGLTGGYISSSQNFPDSLDSWILVILLIPLYIPSEEALYQKTTHHPRYEEKIH